MAETLFYILCGVITAAVAAVMLHPLQKKQSRQNNILSIVLLILVPLGAGVMYLAAGKPDVPSQSGRAVTAEQNARRQVMLLAEKPVEVIEKTGGSDASAFAVMAELNMRLGSRENAEKFLKQAVAAAEKSGDMRLDHYRSGLKVLSE